MCGVEDTDKDKDINGPKPTTPSKVQSSAWSAHPSVRKVLFILCLSVFCSTIWGLVITLISFRSIRDTFSSWSFFPKELYVKAYTIPLPGKVAWFYWVIYFTNMGLIQGPMTIALHCTARNS